MLIIITCGCLKIEKNRKIDMNIINAIINLINNPIIKLVDDYKGRNRANNVGDALEENV